MAIEVRGVIDGGDEIRDFGTGTFDHLGGQIEAEWLNAAIAER